MPDPAAEAAAAATAKAAADAKSASDNTAAADKAAADKALADKATAKAEAEKKGAALPISLKLPEGSLLDAAMVEKTSAYAKEKGLSQDHAQALLERESAAAGAYNEALLASHKAMTVRWIDEVKADKEVGGANFVTASEDARRALARFAPPELMKMLDDTGYGNKLEVVKTFAAIGRAMKDDKLITGASASGAQKSAAEIMYPTHSNKK